jgi:hypothetical protein
MSYKVKEVGPATHAKPMIHQRAVKPRVGFEKARSAA